MSRRSVTRAKCNSAPSLSSDGGKLPHTPLSVSVKKRAQPGRDVVVELLGGGFLASLPTNQRHKRCAFFRGLTLFRLSRTGLAGSWTTSTKCAFYGHAGHTSSKTPFRGLALSEWRTTRPERSFGKVNASLLLATFALRDIQPPVKPLMSLAFSPPNHVIVELTSVRSLCRTQ